MGQQHGAGDAPGNGKVEDAAGSCRPNAKVVGGDNQVAATFHAHSLCRWLPLCARCGPCNGATCMTYAYPICHLWEQLESPIGCRTSFSLPKGASWRR